MAKKSLTEGKPQKKGQAKTVPKLPTGKSGVAKKGPVPPKRSRATPLSQEVSSESDWQGSKNPITAQNPQDTEEGPPGQFLEKLEGEAMVQQFLVSHWMDMEKVGDYDKELAKSLKERVSLIIKALLSRR